MKDRTQQELDRVPMSAAVRAGFRRDATIKKPERTETGGYVGAIGGEGLSAAEKKAIRKVLAATPEPLFIGSIAARAGIAINTPQSQQLVSDFVGKYLVSTKEAEMHLEGMSKKTGRQIFKGFAGTDHLRNLIEKGLA